MSSTLSGTEWAVVCGIIIVCIVVSVVLVRMTKQPSKHAADPRARQNLTRSVQRDRAWKPRPNRVENPWRSQPQTAARTPDATLGPVGTLVTAHEDTPSNGSCDASTE